MKPHKILKSFDGSQTGNDNKHFKEGSVEPLSKALAAIVVKEGWAELIAPSIVGDKGPEIWLPPAGAHEPEEKAIDEAPKNKMKKAPDNKGKK